MRYYRENDGMEPRLHFRLANGYELVVLLPIGEEWVEKLTEAVSTRPEVQFARIVLWNGQMLLNLQEVPRTPHNVKVMREDDT